ncbi:hypothetical protein RHGRI_033118 [Rhododendron griersonianum]|uniref:Uncharacterized protein n=1 Tax=Rhododendron griersonianum TaxID=479676 RepID=A0AAV6HZN6_9ERIC|nr:hypothetical protein RHGRI_033118 [Rhododendron griersonianum]
MGRSQPLTLSGSQPLTTHQTLTPPSPSLKPFSLRDRVRTLPLTDRRFHHLFAAGPPSSSKLSLSVQWRSQKSM